MNLAETLQIPAELMPDQPALSSTGDRLTYTELQQLAARYAAWLTRCGIGSGSTVASLQSFSPSFTALLYGTLATGARFAPLTARARSDELVVLLDGLAPDLLVHDDRYAATAADAVAQLSVAAPELAGTETLAQTVGSLPTPDSFNPVQPADGATAILLHTSGTTGRPKPVALTHEGLTTSLLVSVEPPDGTPRGATLLAVPNHHIAGLASLLNSLFTGRRVELLPSFSSADWLAAVAGGDVDHAFVVPTMLQRILADPAFHRTDLTGLRTVAYGAAPMPRRVIVEAMERFPEGCQFVASYGQTETGGTVCLLDAVDHRRARQGDAGALVRLGSIGRPVPEVEITILDEAGSPVAPGTPGEIAISFGEGPGRRTGDLGRRDQDGYVFLTSRQDDLIIRGGENIDPVEIETVLGSHADVAEVAVAGLPSEEWGQVVAAFVVPRSGATPSPEELVVHVKRSLASFKAPSEVHFVQVLPRTALGKLRRRDLVSAHRGGV